MSPRLVVPLPRAARGRPASALLLGGVGYGSAGVPSIDAGVLQALLIAVTLMQLSGPVWALFGLRYAAGEAPKRNPDRSRG